MSIYTEREIEKLKEGREEIISTLEEIISEKKTNQYEITFAQCYHGLGDETRLHLWGAHFENQPSKVWNMQLFVEVFEICEKHNIPVGLIVNDQTDEQIATYVKVDLIGYDEALKLINQHRELELQKMVFRTYQSYRYSEEYQPSLVIVLVQSQSRIYKINPDYNKGWFWYGFCNCD